jgi:DNA-binding response OmpR family regulator
MVRILSVSYDEVLLRTRQMLLQERGYKVISSLGFTDALKHCRSGVFDIFILGHSIPYTDKQELVKTFLKHCSAPVISLRRNPGEELVDGADFHIEPDPQPLLDLVAKLAKDRSPKEIT